MTTSNLNFNNFKVISKDRLFYDQFEYAVTFFLDEASALRELSHAAIDRTISHRQNFFATKLSFYNKNLREKEILGVTIANLHLFCDFLLGAQAEYKNVISGNWVTIYTNDLKLLNQIANIDYIDRLDYKKVLVNRPRDTIVLKNSLYTTRGYFRGARITAQERAILCNFLTAQKEHIRLSPGLKSWVKSGYNTIFDYFFIDYTDDQWLTMLSLVRPGLVRKTVKILQDK